ncbi:hypothetical protein H8K32_19765 [Undibacterium jejuense]|uniref:Uncharacterized protein n=1 Tax=Undibacterium jejuense TaxID=1344949 RepID=A0A923HTB3_9BURK|nr:hypothetical protein [Undibacterium jejuense]MBC3864338.1 hypothetical protein [Undibacterium jejuense]
MFINAFLITLRRLAIPFIAGMIGSNVVMVFTGSWSLWIVPIQIGIILLGAIIFSPIEYYKLSNYKKMSNEQT